MIVLETKNPLTSAKIIGEETDPKTYHEFTGGGRGDPDHIMSRSELTEFARCPHRWLMGYKDGEEDTKATEWGSLADCLVLTPYKFRQAFSVTPETYPDKKNGEAKPWNWNATYCKEWRENHSGTPIKSETFEQAKNAKKFLFGNEDIASFINSSRKQVFVMSEYYDAQTKLVVPIKCLIDLVPELASPFPKSLGDFKTCRNASSFSWSRDVFQYGYHVQAALYLDAYSLATGEDRVDFRHILQESFPPWEPAKRIVSSEFIELGRVTYLNALKRYCQCLAEGHWPGYDEDAKFMIEGWSLTEPEAWMVNR